MTSLKTSSPTTVDAALLSFCVILTSLVFTTPASAQLTIPKRDLGWLYMPHNASIQSVVTLTAYMDLTCPDSKQAYLTLIPLADQMAGKNFQFRFRSFSLPYHRNSHVINMAVHLVRDLVGNGGVFPFITEVYNNLAYLVPSATADKTDAQVISDVIAPIVLKSVNIPTNTFKQKISESKYDLNARLDFKYGCTRGVYGTPSFTINDVIVDATPSWTVSQWKDVISPLL